MKVELKKLRIKALLINCPMGKSLKSCPLREIREQTIEDRMVTVEKMSEQEIDSMITQHENCVCNRIEDEYNKQQSQIQDIH